MLYLMLVLIGAEAPYDTHMPHMHSVGTQWGCTYCTVHSVGLHILHCTQAWHTTLRACKTVHYTHTHTQGGACFFLLTRRVFW